ncbi:O-antigen ligase family protein [Listeria weihenstephanensis]|uniref:O-antigen ligase family protein n=1 Tax=Listeria weihenstephanensis TaxID=1006155 RepID=A0A841ZB43_9LIST|nr:O-antigen ligase family protein [Listeria weihenstephanensis]MBC1501707.1 O-antigen ligase family protein [Listeria weihenstephanensis]
MKVLMEKMSLNSITFRGIVIAAMALLSILSPIFPWLLAIPVIVIGVLYVNKINTNKWMYGLFVAILMAGFWGAYASLPQMPSLFLFRILIAIHFVFFLFSKKDFSTIKVLKVPLICMVVWIFYSVITLIWTTDVALSLNAIYFQFEACYLVFMCVYYISSWKKMRQVLLWITANYTISIGIGLYEVLSGEHLRFSAGILLGYADPRPTGWLVNTNDYASYLVIYFGLVSLVLLSSKKKINIAIWLCLLAIVTYLVIESHSRTGFLGLVSVVALVLFKVLRIQTFILTIFGGAVALCAKVIYSSVASSGLTAQLVDSFTGKGDSTQERVFMYKYVIQLCKDHHFLGVGVGNTPRFVFEALYGSSNIDLSGSQTMAAHNFWLSIISDIGFIGFIPILIFFIYFIYQAITMYITNNTLKGAIPATVILGFIAVSVGSSSIFEMRVIWIALGLGLAVVCLLQREKHPNENVDPWIK